MNISIQQLTLTNFKGAKNLTVDFGKITNIYGDNATGKTTIQDAWCWLLFGKNSNEQKDFEIKTLDSKGNVIARIDHEVTGHLLVDGEPTILKRVFREKWTKKRGSETAEFTGHETTYFWNDVPLSQSEYQNKISLILNEDIFKLITNPLYFNNNLKWDARRNVLLKLSGGVSNEEVSGGSKDFEGLIAQLGTQKTLEELKKEIGAKKKKIKDELDLIPTRIDEAQRNKPEAVNEAEVTAQINALKQKLEEVRAAMTDAVQAQKNINDSQLAIQSEIFELKRKANEKKESIRNILLSEDKNDSGALDELKAQISQKQIEIKNTKDEIIFIQSKIDNRLISIDTANARRDHLRNQWFEVNGGELVFDESKFCCPTCKRALEQEDVELKRSEMIANFNKDKQSKIQAIEKEGGELKIQVEQYEAGITAEKTTLSSLQSKLSTLEASITGLTTSLEQAQRNFVAPAPIDIRLTEALEIDADYQSIMKTIIDKQYLMDNAPKAVVNEELKIKESSLLDEVNNLRYALSKNSDLAMINERIEFLEQQETKLAQELTQLEGTEFTIQEFVKAKMELMERKINGLFRYVSFKLFDKQINGGETECCETLINTNGSLVPFSDANTAAKIQAGIDIINAISKHKGAVAPIFIDNRESVVQIPETEAQIVNFYVVEGQPLTINTANTTNLRQKKLEFA